jgi:glycerol-3-phosphate responsive antiterminator
MASPINQEFEFCFAPIVCLLKGKGLRLTTVQRRFVLDSQKINAATSTNRNKNV